MLLPKDKALPGSNDKDKTRWDKINRHYYVESMTEAVDALRSFVKAEPRGISWAIVTELEGGQLLVSERFSQPCYGETHIYGKDDYEGVSKPGDLFSPFPDGKPVAFAWRAITIVQKDWLAHQRNRWLFDPMRSPFRAILGNEAEQIVEDGVLRGIVWHTGELPSNLLTGFMIFIKEVSNYGAALDFNRQWEWKDKITSKTNQSLFVENFPAFAVAIDFGQSWSGPGGFTASRHNYGSPGHYTNLYRWLNALPTKPDNVPSDPWLLSNRQTYSRKGNRDWKSAFMIPMSNSTDQTLLHQRMKNAPGFDDLVPIFMDVLAQHKEYVAKGV